MIYTRGKAGPVSRMSIEVSFAEITDAGANSRAKAGGVATKAGGVATKAGGRVQAVEFTVQGRHFDDARAALAPGGTIDADVRWTGGSAVTIVKVHAATPGVQGFDGETLQPARRRRDRGLSAQIDALFG